MGYSIYYNKAFIHIGDKFIPLANSGSSNCSEFLNGREVPEKNWNVLNWKREEQFLFSKAEIKELARFYDLYNQESGMIFKTRNRCFKPGELERWINCGMKRAYTVEEYVSFGNNFFVCDYSPDGTGKWKRYPFQTTGEMLRILEDLEHIRQKDIMLCNNREVIRPKIR